MLYTLRGERTGFNRGCTQSLRQSRQQVKSSEVADVILVKRQDAGCLPDLPLRSMFFVPFRSM